jgi:hypothetical protein
MWPPGTDAARIVEVKAGGGTKIIAPTVNDKGLLFPVAVALDAAGNLYIADQQTVDSIPGGRVIEVPANGDAATDLTTASGLVTGYPTGLAVDAGGDLFIADSDGVPGASVVEVPAGGGAPTGYPLKFGGNGFSTAGMIFDGGGNLYVAGTAFYGDSYSEFLFAKAPSLEFDPTNVGGQSDDSPRSVTVKNIGTAPLSFSVPASGDNPAISVNSSWTAARHRDVRR